MRLADADVLPVDPAAYADAVARYVKEIDELAEAKRKDTAEKNKQVEENLPWAVADPRKPFVAPKAEDPCPHFDLSALKNASEALIAAAAAYAHAFDAAFQPGAAKLSPEKLAALNAALRNFERSFTSEAGLPGRDWYRHFVFAPGAYTGYSVKTLPAVRESIEQKKWSAVNGAAAQTAAVIEKAAEQTRMATRLLGP